MTWLIERYGYDEKLRPEGPASRLRQAMRQQMREDADRMVITPKNKPAR